MNAQLAADKEQRVRHIVPIADKSQLLALDLIPLFPQRQHVAQHHRVAEAGHRLGRCSDFLG